MKARDNPRKINLQMEGSNLQIKKLVVPVAVLVLVMLFIIIVLYGNKKKINEANKPVDRTYIPVPVSVARASVSPLEVNIQYPGLLQPSDEAMLYAQASGLISFLDIALGRKVNKGEVVGKLDTRILEINLKNAQVDLASAAINKEKMLADYNRSKDLYENKAGLEVNMLSAKNNYENALNNFDNAQIQINLIRQQIANASIIAPLSGNISAHKVKQGEFVNPGNPIATISNIDKIKATVYVDQQMSYRLKTGQTATVTSPVFNEHYFTGKIIFISPVADVNHNYRIDLLISGNENMVLRGGTDVLVSFNSLFQKGTLQIPQPALVNSKEPYVFVAENGRARIRVVKTGIVQNDKVEVLSGIKEGEMVIINGQINLREGSNISIIK